MSRLLKVWEAMEEAGKKRAAQLKEMEKQGAAEKFAGKICPKKRKVIDWKKKVKQSSERSPRGRGRSLLHGFS